jgi:predicted DsbA family dithiol-disulfide isomerase
MMMNMLENTHSTLGVEVYTYDVDSDQKFTQEQGVRSVPTLKFFEGGEIKRVKPGVMSEASLKEFVS